MKKILNIFLILAFIFNASLVYSNSKNFFENRLQNLLLPKNAIIENNSLLPNFAITQNSNEKALLQNIAISDFSENKNLLPKIAITKIWTWNLKIEKNILSWEIFLTPDANIQPYIFVSFPNWNVQKFLINKNNEKIFIKIPALQNWKYQLEILDNRGFPVFLDELNNSENINNINNEKNFQNINEILEDVNKIRISLGYQKLELNPLLQNIAIRKVEDMRQNFYIGHNSPEWKNIFSFLTEVEKKNFYRLWENISGGKDLNISDSYYKILNSPAHKYLFLNSDWKNIWMAYIFDNWSGYFVQIFSD